MAQTLRVNFGLNKDNNSANRQLIGILTIHDGIQTKIVLSEPEQHGPHFGRTLGLLIRDPWWTSEKGTCGVTSTNHLGSFDSAPQVSMNSK